MGSSDSNFETCTITVPRTNNVALLYQGAPPEVGSVRVQVYRVHGTENSDYIKIIDGTVSQANFSGSEADLIISVEGVLSREIPRGKLSYYCQNCLYDNKCKVIKDAYALKCYVDIDMTYTHIMSTNLNERPSGYFTDGFIKMGNAYRAIKLHSNDSIWLKYPISLADKQGEFIAYPGCDRMFKTCATKFNNTDNFNNVWNVIEDSARYAFNSPHAYSMGGDSAYQAWFKAHHTATFYEVAINHYQEKNKKDKIDALVKEAIKFYDYKLGNYEFGTDNRTVTIDEEKKLIYPNLSSIKGFGEGVSQTLYELGQKQYKDFVEVLTALFSNSINKTIVDKLIKIDYFRKYGDINTLLVITKYYDVLYGAKTISKDKAEKNGLPFKLLSKYGNETAKQFNKIDSQPKKSV